MQKLDNGGESRNPKQKFPCEVEKIEKEKLTVTKPESIKAGGAGQSPQRTNSCKADPN